MNLTAFGLLRRLERCRLVSRNMKFERSRKVQIPHLLLPPPPPSPGLLPEIHSQLHLEPGQGRQGNRSTAHTKFRWQEGSTYLWYKNILFSCFQRYTNISRGAGWRTLPNDQHILVRQSVSYGNQKKSTVWRASEVHWHRAGTHSYATNGSHLAQRLGRNICCGIWYTYWKMWLVTEQRFGINIC